MKATSGAFPKFEVVSVGKTKSGKDSKKGLYEAEFGGGTYQFDLTSGWVPKRRKGWLDRADAAYRRSQNNKGSALGYRYLTGTDGKKRRAYYLKGYNAAGWHVDRQQDQERFRHSGGTFGWYSGSPMANEILKQEELSFSGKPGEDYRSVDIPEGHIQKIEYNVNTHMMRVTFGGEGGPNGVASREDVCLFYPVPDEVAGTLLRHAENRTTQGYYDSGRRRPKHLVGIEFWNLIRIRGQSQGAKVPFEYEKHGTYKPVGRSDRYKVKLTRKEYETVLGRRPPAGLKDSDTVTVVLDGKEHDKWQQLTGSSKPSEGVALPATGNNASQDVRNETAVSSQSGVVKSAGQIDSATNPKKGKKWHKSDLIEYVNSDHFSDPKQREQYAKYIRHGQFVRAWNLLRSSSYISTDQSSLNRSIRHAGPQDVFVYDDDE